MASNTTQLLTGTQPSFLPSQIKDVDAPSRILKSHSRQTLTFTQLVQIIKTGSVSHKTPPSPWKRVHEVSLEPPELAVMPWKALPHLEHSNIHTCP